jgi:hypothetical protein
VQGRLFPTRNCAGTVEGLYKYAPREGAKAEKSIGKEAEKSSPSASNATPESRSPIPLPRFPDFALNLRIAVLPRRAELGISAPRDLFHDGRDVGKWRWRGWTWGELLRHDGPRPLPELAPSTMRIQVLADYMGGSTGSCSRQISIGACRTRIRMTPSVKWEAEASEHGRHR